MTQVSRPQGGKYTDGYHDAGGYTSEQWARIFSILFTLNEETEGVVKHLSDLAVTNPLDTVIRVASGAALVRGRLFINEDQDNPASSSNVDFTVDPPATGSRIDRVVLVQNNTDYDYDGTPDYSAAVLQIPDDTSDYEYGTSFVVASGIPPHTCRLALLLGDESSGGAMRALTQDASVIAGDIWMLELARYTINSAGAITLTDVRDYAPKFTTENLEDDTITAAKIADDAVTTDAIADSAVTPAKIANRTREVFLPASMVKGPGVLDIDADQRGVEAVYNATTTAYLFGVIPQDFVSDAEIVPVICRPSTSAPGTAGFEYGAWLAANGETAATHSYTDDTLIFDYPVDTIVLLPALDLPDAAAGDTLGVYVSRVIAGDSWKSFYIRGAILRYTADS